METPYYNYWQKGEAGAQSGLSVCVYPRMEFSKLPRGSQSRDKRSLDKLWVFPEDRYFNADIVHLFIFASFSSTPHVIFQVAAFCQIWQASVEYCKCIEPPVRRNEPLNARNRASYCEQESRPTIFIYRTNLLYNEVACLRA